MSVVSFEFLGFLAALAVVYYVLPMRVRKWALLAGSAAFWLLCGWQGAAYLTAETLLIWGCARLMGRFSERRGVCRALLVGGMVTVFGAMVLMKALSQLQALPDGLLVPIGLSYFTFQSVGYLIDVYRGKITPEKNYAKVLLFAGFFPQMTQGPITTWKQLMPQLDSPHRLSPDGFVSGVFLMAWGFFKKLVIADRLMPAVSVLVAAAQELPGWLVLATAAMYAIVLYADFSGGIDIIRGAAELLGTDLPENFRRPFFAASIADYWRRWHISLTSWFRDYLYIPLGGNRRGKARQYINQLVVFLVSGLWHGASLSMMVWGLLNGVYLCVGKATQDARRKLTRHNPLYHFTPVRRIFQTAVTYLLFTSCIIFFRSSEVFEGSKGIADALYIYGHLFSGWGKLFTAPDAIGRALVSIGLSVQTALVLAVSILVVETLESVQEPVNRTIRKVPIFLRWPLYYALVLGMLFFGSFANSGSIYGRF